MDALAIQEEAGVGFAAQNGNMNACDHDMRAAARPDCSTRMKTGSWYGQADAPASGGNLWEFPDMIGAGLLERSKGDAARMIHVMAGTPFPAGTVIISARQSALRRRLF